MGLDFYIIIFIVAVCSAIFGAHVAKQFGKKEIKKINDDN